MKRYKIIKRIKKGFTLIELLATIAVVAILAVVTVPIISKVVESGRREAFRDSAYAIFDAVDLYIAESDTSEVPEVGIQISELRLNNRSLKEGIVVKNDDEELFEKNVTDGKYCAVGTKTDLTVYKAIDGKCDVTVPTCKIDIEEEVSRYGWYHTNVRLNMSTNLAGGSGFTYGLGFQEIYDHKIGAGKIGRVSKEESKEGTYTYKGYVKSGNGDKGYCEKIVRIDKTKPTIHIQVGASTSVIQMTDNNSIVSYSIEKNRTNTPNYQDIQPNKTISTTYSNPTSGTYYVYSKDIAGNETEKSYDTMVPTCTFSGFQTNRWYNTNLTATLNTSKAGSSGIEYGIGTTETYGNKVTEGKIGSIRQAISKEGTSQINGYVKSGDGLKGSCSTTIHIDKTAPKIAIRYNATSATITFTDNIGIVGYAISSVATNNPSFTAVTTTKTYTTTYTAPTQGTYYIYVKDVAGNITNTTLDTVIPSCSFSGINTGIWYTGNVVGTMSTNQAGVTGMSYGIGTGENYSHSVGNGGIGRLNYTFQTEGQTVLMGYVKGGTGRKASCSTVVHIDKSGPTINISPNGGVTNTGSSLSATISASDNLTGVVEILYRFTDANTTLTDRSQFTGGAGNGALVTSPTNLTGNNFLWVYARDGAGNFRITRSGVFHFHYGSSSSGGGCYTTYHPGYSYTCYNPFNCRPGASWRNETHCDYHCSDGIDRGQVKSYTCPEYGWCGVGDKWGGSTSAYYTLGCGY